MLETLKGFFRRDSDPIDPAKEEVILAAIESAVDRADPKIRLVSNYKKKLRRAVAHALEYADGLVDRVPGPIAINGRTFATDPRLRAFFISVDQLQTTFSLSRSMRTFFEAPENKKLPECYALLIMEKRERNILGMELDGEMILKDVPQTTVSFAEHHVITPAATPADLKQALIQRVFKDLVACALNRILQLQSRRHELERQRGQLRVQLRVLESSIQAPDESAENLERGNEEKIKATRHRLNSIEQKLQEAKSSFTTLKDYIALLNEVFGHPEEYFRLREESVRLNRVGIKVSERSPQVVDEIPFAAVELGKNRRVVAISVKYPRAEMVSVDHYLEKALLT